MPEATIASAVSRINCSFTLSVNLFQLFQPICGVKASWSNFWPGATGATGATMATTGFLVAQADSKISGIKMSMRFMVVGVFCIVVMGVLRFFKKVIAPFSAAPCPRKLRATGGAFPGTCATRDTGLSIR